MDNQQTPPSSSPEGCPGFEYSESIPGDVEKVGRLISDIMDRVRTVGCIGDHEFEVEVALLEAVANAVKHGCKGDASKRVSIRVECSLGEGLLVEVRDPGAGFDPAGIPSPVEGANLYGTSGRGVFLINRLMDEVRYEDNGATLIMRKRSTVEGS